MSTPTKACQILTFFKLCPFNLNQIIVPSSENYLLFKLARKIIIYCFSYELSDHYLVDLENTICNFLAEWKENYEELHGFVPNMHFINHIVRDIKLFGHPSVYSCLRYEAKHQVFKRISKKKSGYKNHQKTLMNTHARQLEHQFSGGSDVYSDQQSNLVRGSCVTINGRLVLIDKVQCKDFEGIELQITATDHDLLCHEVVKTDNRIYGTSKQVDRPSQAFLTFDTKSYILINSFI